MKKFYLLNAAVAMSVLLTFAAASPTANPHDKAAVAVTAAVDIVLQNKCTRDVKYSLKSGGTTTNGTVAKGDKAKLSVAVGTEILVDGEVFMTVADSDAGQTFIVCR